MDSCKNWKLMNWYSKTPDFGTQDKNIASTSKIRHRPRLNKSYDALKKVQFIFRFVSHTKVRHFASELNKIECSKILNSSMGRACWTNFFLR